MRRRGARLHIAEMSYANAQTAITTANLPDDASKLAFAGETVYVWRDYFASYRTIYDLLIALDPSTASAKVRSIQSAVEAADPIADQFLLAPGDSKGNGGGVNINLPQAQAMVAQLLGGGVITQAESDAILNLARSNPRPRYQAEWGLDAFTADTLARLAQYVAWEALTIDVDRWIGAIDSCASVLASVAGITADMLASRRAAMVAIVQDYKSKIDAGTDTSDMPADGAAAWAKAGQ